VETTVSTDDADLIKDVAKVLREDGVEAGELRRAIRSLVPTARAGTGAELLEFFQRSPLADETSSLERDSSGGRSADFD